MRLLATALACALASTSASANSSCSESNDNGDANCNVDCDTEQTAECSHGTGSSTPECKCTGTSEPSRLYGLWHHQPARLTQSLWIKIADPAPVAPDPTVTYIDLPAEVAARIRTRPNWVSHNFPQDTANKWFKVNSVTNPNVQVISADLGTPTLGAPSSSYREIIRYKNCTSVQQTIAVKYTTSSRGTVDLTLTHGFDNSVQATTGFTVKILDSIGLNASDVQASKISLSSAQKNSWDWSSAVESDNPVIFPSYTDVVGFVTRTSRRQIFPFTAVVVINPDIGYEFYNSAGNSATAHQIHTMKLDSFFSNASDRTFTVQGLLSNATSSETTIQLLSKILTSTDQTECPTTSLTPVPVDSALILNTRPSN